MSTRTLNSATSKVLKAIQRPSSTVPSGHYYAADIAAINAAITADYNPALPPTQWLEQAGLLVIPGRGVLKVLTGDVIAVDHFGWPILVCNASITDSASTWTLT
jgi:hypothetical protein